MSTRISFFPSMPVSLSGIIHHSHEIHSPGLKYTVTFISFNNNIIGQQKSQLAWDGPAGCFTRVTDKLNLGLLRKTTTGPPEFKSLTLTTRPHYLHIMTTIYIYFNLKPRHATAVFHNRNCHAIDKLHNLNLTLT